MKAPELITSDESIRLIEPDVERDAPLSLEWLSGQEGRKSLELMGVPRHQIHAPTLDEEEVRIESFLDRQDELVWMIEVDGEVVGSVEVWLDDATYIPAPALSIFIGDRLIRGQGIGTKALTAVVAWLTTEKGYDVLFARHLVNNEVSAQLVLKVGFEPDGDSYTDSDGLEWQNVILRQGDV